MKRKIIELEEIDSIEDFETANTFLLLDKNLNEIVTNKTNPL